MTDDSDQNLILMLHSFQDSLRRDKLEFEHALDEFLSTRRLPMQEHAGSRQPYSDKTDDTSTEMMLDRRRNANNRQFLTRGQQPVEEVPKYGLPGMGQYEEKQKKYKAQLRDEYRSYMREQNAATTRRRLTNNRDDSKLNYDELLAKKREEERNYRNRNDGFANGGMRANSDGYLNRMPMPDQNYGRRPNFDVRPEVEEVTSMMSRIQRYNDELASRDDEDVQYNYGSHAGASERPHSYPHDTHPSPSNFQHNGYSSEQWGHRRSESPKFITLDHTHPRATNEQSGGATTYLNDLDNQVEASRRRRQNEKEEQLRYERKLEEDNKAYDPWGRGGAGAPMRDRDGNVIASRRQMGNVEERTSRGGHRLPPSNITDANNRKKSDAQDTLPNYAIPRSPLPGQSSKYEGRKFNHDAYQEDLRRQIEDKKRRDKEEKEKERLEEERLMRRIEEENEKMRRDHEEEIQKQRLREDERRRRNEELQKRQEEQRKAAEMQKREVKLKRRQEQFEDRGVTLARQSSVIDDPGIKSPPLPGRKCKMATNKPTIMANPAKGSSTATHKQGASKDHILSQLSVMRQQLEREQQLMQKQLKKEMGNDYEVYDKRTVETMNERNKAPSDDRNKPSIYRPSTPPAQPKPPVKKIPSALKYNLPVYDDFVSDAKATAPTDTKSTVAPVAKSRTLWPAMAMAIRATDGLKPLQGESLFLGVDGYESTSPGIHDRQDDWHRDGMRHHEASDEYHYDVDQLASHDAARRRYLSTLKDDPDEIKEDSFLDEFLAKNLHLR